MRKRYDYSDERLSSFCAYCGRLTETWDHIPPKAFLDRPLPDNLPKVPACEKCNNDAAINEQYVACLIECGLTGSSNWEDIKRDNIALTLKRDRRIRSQFESARQIMPDGSTWLYTENSRLCAVILKLARGHAAYELATPLLEDAEKVLITTLVQMSDRERATFETPPSISLLPEVGSRSMQLLIENTSSQRLAQPWIVVQPNNYRYLAIVDYDRITVRLVIREYLACEVAWQTT